MIQLQRLNQRFRESFGDNRFGNRPERRAILSNQVGPIRSLRRLDPAALAGFLGGRALVGVDGSINTFGGTYPHYVDFLRALAKPSQGDPILLKEIHSPVPDEGNRQPERLSDQEIRQQKLAALEVAAALQAAEANPPPGIILMDGPLVRFDMRARESFDTLRECVTKRHILLIGCIENIESRVISTMLGDEAPSAWRDCYDTDLLWETLDPGEVLEVSRPVKGVRDWLQTEEEPSAPLLRTWFMRPSLAPGVVGMEMLEAQADQMGSLADYLYNLTPHDGRGIPIWIDIVDREVRLTNVELEAYLQLLDPELRRLFAVKRGDRIY